LETAPKAEVKVLSDGALFLNGEPATLETIDQQLTELERVKGVAWYYREGGQAEPPPQATKVVALVIKHRLPVRISSKPDFSDSMNEKGVSHRRPTLLQGEKGLRPLFCLRGMVDSQ